MAKFIENESYKHKIAKDILASWLRKAEKENPNCCTFAQFAWRKNKGVRTELKFYEGSHPYYYEQGNDMGKILFVPDITVFNNGIVYYIFEVVHTHGITDEKKEKMRIFFYPYTVEVFTVRAEWIMCQTKKPDFVHCEKVYL